MKRQTNKQTKQKAKKQNKKKKLLYSAIPRKDLQSRGAVHYQHQNPLDNQTESKSTIKAYINMN